MNTAKNEHGETSMPSDFEQLKAQFLEDIQTIVMMEDIPAELIINWNYVSASDWRKALKSRML